MVVSAVCAKEEALVVKEEVTVPLGAVSLSALPSSAVDGLVERTVLCLSAVSEIKDVSNKVIVAVLFKSPVVQELKKIHPLRPPHITIKRTKNIYPRGNNRLHSLIAHERISLRFYLG